MSSNLVRARRAAFASAALSAASCFAQSTPTMDSVVVTAMRVETPLSDALMSVDVLSRQDIDRMQPASLAELLQYLPGYEFGRNGGPGTVTSFFLRGHNSANLVILVDGVRTPVDGIGALTAVDVPMNAIERVEVLRGDASALYGDAANAGVIHIITRRSGAGTYAGLGFGEYGARQVKAGVSKQLDDSVVSLAVSRNQSARLSAMRVEQKPAANPDADQSVAEVLDLGWRHQVSKDTRFYVQVGQESAQVDYDEDNFGFGLVSDVYQMDRVTRRIQATLTSYFSKNWRTQISVSNNRQNLEDRKNSVLRTSAYSYGLAQSRHTGLRWDNQLEFSDSGFLIAGLDHAQERYESDATQSGYRTERSMTALFAGLNQELGAWKLQGNARFDTIRLNNYLTDTQKRWHETSFLLGAAYKWESAWRVSANLAQGFRVPTSFDMARSPSLRPEQYFNRELGVAYRQGPLHTRLTVFWNQARDMIITHPSTYQQTNTNAKNRGIEWNGSFLVGQTLFNGSITLQNPRNLDTGLDLARRGKKLATLGVNHPLGEGSVGAQARYQSNRRDQDFSSRTLASYVVLDLLASRRISPEWRMQAKLENAGNRDYQLAYGYNTPRRAMWLMLDYTTY